MLVFEEVDFLSINSINASVILKHRMIIIYYMK